MLQRVFWGFIVGTVLAAAQEAHTVTLAADTALEIRLNESLSSKKNKPGDSFLTTLDEQLVIDGFIIADKGAQVEGRVVEAENPIRAKGPAHLTLELTTLSTADGQQLAIETVKFVKKGDSAAADTAGGAIFGGVLGTIVGAAAGGGKGAAVGAGTGAAAGAAGVALTPSQAAVLRPETKLTFKVARDVRITEKL